MGNSQTLEGDISYEGDVSVPTEYDSGLPECIDTGNYDFSTFGLDSNVPWAYVAWASCLIITIPLSFLLSCFLGKISGNYICVPMVSSDKFELREDKHKDAVNFTGFAVKIKAVIKAVSLSGIAVTIVNTWITMGAYDPCAGYEGVSSTMILAWIASFSGYILVWKIDISLGVTKLNLWQRLFWVFSEKLIILICGSSFVRVIYIHNRSTDTSSDDFCYCSDDQLMFANIFTIIYVAMFPFIWFLNKVKCKGLIVFFASQYLLCKNPNCCCEVTKKEPTGKVGKVCMPFCKCCCGKVLGVFFMPVVMFVVAPFICLYIRFGIISDKWNDRVKGHKLDVSDMVFIWIIVVSFFFFTIVCAEKIKNKISPPKEASPEEDQKGVELHVDLAKENEDKDTEKKEKSGEDKEKEDSVKKEENNSDATDAVVEMAENENQS